MNTHKRLLLACQNDDVEAARKAIQDGADLTVVSEDGFPVIQFASSSPILQLLINSGCDVDQIDQNGWTLLSNLFRIHFYREVEPNLHMVKALLRFGANPNYAHHENGWTACHFAIHPEGLQLLIDFGADLRIRNCYSKTPFQYMKKHGQLPPDELERLRPIFEAWTPHKMLPRWIPFVHRQYICESREFENAIITLLLCLRRYRFFIAREIGLQIVEYVAEMHRKEMWWPAWEDFDMKEYT